MSEADILGTLHPTERDWEETLAATPGGAVPKAELKRRLEALGAR